MRIRQIKPEFWKDAKLSELSDATRLFFVGTWQISDDSGWFRWNPEEIGAELYPFGSRKVRERRIRQHVEALVAIGRIHIHPCGHAQIPHMPAHQHLAGTTRRVTTIYEEHSRCVPATPREAPRLPAPVSIGSVGKGSVSKLDGETTIENAIARAKRRAAR